ncbi:MAG: putative addiction module antidote protein [Holophaga sp.]|nr:putative addiction module antidote protein [Holophaga sp.]
MTRRILKTKPFESADFLASGSQKLINDYLEVAWEEMFEMSDPDIFVTALGNVAKARGMTEVAKATGLARESLYRSLASGSKVRFDTILKLMAAFNFFPNPGGRAQG